jgi:hypothetical protein
VSVIREKPETPTNMGIEILNLVDFNIGCATIRYFTFSALFGVFRIKLEKKCWHTKAKVYLCMWVYTITYSDLPSGMMGT